MKDIEARATTKLQLVPCVSAGELRKASSAVATSTWGSLTSVNTLVQAMFPALQQEAPNQTPEREEYNDYNYWHVTPPIIIDSEDDAFGDPEGMQSNTDSDEDSFHHHFL
jgi:hypothetical protein